MKHMIQKPQNTEAWTASLDGFIACASAKTQRLMSRTTEGTTVNDKALAVANYITAMEKTAAKFITTRDALTEMQKTVDRLWEENS
jgi:wyosine [tRNA(Phe)-imidazoG37] synthetase (radical SAM superfamily)